MVNIGGRLSAFVLFGLAASCTLECTFLPCLSGIALHFDGVPETGTVISLEVGSAAPIVVVCESAFSCREIVHFLDMFPDVATVRITSGTDEVVYEVFPEYEEYEPNGSGCGTCSRAEIQLALP